MVRSIIKHVNLLLSFWGNALLTAAYILNHMAFNSILSTSYELWNNKKYNLGYLHQ